MSDVTQQPVPDTPKKDKNSQISEWKCKICKSAHRDEIDALILGGTRYVDIIKVASERGMSISESGISRHKSAHTVAPGSAAKRLESFELEAHATYMRLMQEVRDRDFKKLTTAQLLASAQGFGKVVAEFRALPKEND